MWPGSLPLTFNGSVPGHEKLFNVRRCSMYMYTGIVNVKKHPQMSLGITNVVYLEFHIMWENRCRIP